MKESEIIELATQCGYECERAIALKLEASGREYWRLIYNSNNLTGNPIHGTPCMGGVSRLSDNYLIAKVAEWYVEIFRNIPLLLQIFFSYVVFYLVSLTKSKRILTQLIT